MQLKIIDWNKISVNNENGKSRIAIVFDNENSENSQFDELTKIGSFLLIVMLGLLFLLISLLFFLEFLARLSIPCLTLFGAYELFKYLIV